MGWFDRLFGRKPKNGDIDGYAQEYYDAEQTNAEGGRDEQNSGNEQDASGQSVQEQYDGIEHGQNADAAVIGESECGETVQQEQNIMSREEYISEFRKEYRQYFPKSLDTVESHMQLPYMIGLTFDISPVTEYASNNVYAGISADELSEKGRSLVAKTAMVLEKYISSSDVNMFSASLSRVHEDSLEKTWIVLDFYCRMLKTEYIQNINMLYDMATDEVIKRKSAPRAVMQGESYEDVLSGCASKIAEGAFAEEIDSLKKRLFEKLCELESIYVIQDETFNNSFPYIGADGRIEIQTNPERAASLKDFLERNGESKVSITEYKKDSYEKLFEDLVHNGLTIIRLDNGLTPIEIDIDGLFAGRKKNLIEICNRYARRMFISELQYGYRLKNLQDKPDCEDYKVLSASMLKARTDGYRALAGGLVYVFNTDNNKRPGTTLYTRSAIENAAEIMKTMGIVDENTLIADGDESFDVYEGEIALRTVSRKGSTDGKGYVCAFTDRENAEKIYKRFVEMGANDTIVVMTLSELCRNCAGNAGFILDMTTYGLEIPVENFGGISEAVKSGGIIVGNKAI